MSSSRSPSFSPQTRRLLPPAILILIVFGVLPVRAIRWTQPIGDLAAALVAPLSQPLRALSSWLRPAERRDSAAEAALKEKAEHFEFLYRQQLDENNRLRDTIEELQVQKGLNPELPVSLLTAPVIGTSSDSTSGVLRVRAGSSDGVANNTVATVRGLQLLGRVVSVSTRTCLVQPITRKAAGQIRGRIILDAPGLSLVCLLNPVGDGTLRGEVEFQRSPGGDEPLKPSAGQTVRLDDDRWPPGSQMLRLGSVESVQASTENPQRQVVVVRPAVPRLDRVSEVVLRLTTPDTEGAR